MSEGVKRLKAVKTLKSPNGFPPLEPPSTFTYKIFISYRTLPQRFAPAGSHTPERGWWIYWLPPMPPTSGTILIDFHVFFFDFQRFSMIFIDC